MTRDRLLTFVGANAAWLYAAEIMPRLGALLVVPIWTARVAPGEYARWILAVTSVELLLELSGLGLAPFLTKVVYRYRDDRLPKYFGMAATIMLASTAAVAVTMAAASPWLSPLIIGPGVRPDLFALLAIYVLCAQFNNLAVLYLGSSVRYRSYFVLMMWRWGWSTALLLTLLIGFGLGFYSWVVAAVVTELLVLPLAAWHLAAMRWRWWRRRILRFAFRYSAPTLATSFMSWGHNRVGRYVLSFSGLTAGVGLYGVAQNFASNYGAAVRPLKLVALRVIGHELEDDAESPSFMQFFHGFTCLALAAAFVIALFLGDVMKLFVSRSYQGAQAALPMLVFSLYLNEVYSLYGSLMFRYFKVWFIGLGSMFGFATTMLATVALVPSLGVAGAATAQLAGSMAYVIFAHLYARRVSHRPYRVVEKAGFTLIALLLVVAAEGLSLGVETKLVIAGAALIPYLLLHWRRRAQLFPSLAAALKVRTTVGLGAISEEKSR